LFKKRRTLVLDRAQRAAASKRKAQQAFQRRYIALLPKAPPEDKR